MGILAAAVFVGCGNEVRIETRPNPPVTTCDPGMVPPATLVPLDSVTSGVFIGDTLHLAARVDGIETYVVLGIADDYVWVLDRPADLLGPANLVAATPGTHARMRVDGLSIQVDVIDTSNPAKPTLKQSHTYMAEVPPAWQSAYSIVDGQLLFCGAMSPNPPPELHSVPLDGSSPPVLVTAGAYQLCYGLNQDFGVARGKLWMTWGFSSDLFIYEATPTSVKKIADYQYVPDGVHAYGPVLFAATDGERIVFDPGNENEFFLYSVGSGEVTITHTVFNIPGPKRLLGVVDQVVYLSTPSGIRAYDASKIGPPTDWDTLSLLEYQAEIPFGPELGRLLAANDRFLAVVDSSGTLFLAPRDQSGPVAPIQVHLEALGPPDCTASP